MLENGSGKCELCDKTGGEMLWASAVCRVVRVADADYPGFCRVIWTQHVREMSDLAPGQRQYLMHVVFAVEQVVRELFRPHKINLASFGNVVPHLHWHIIPRWRDDRHFPEPVWGQVQRDAVAVRPEVDSAALRQALTRLLEGPEGQRGCDEQG